MENIDGEQIVEVID